MIVLKILAIYFLVRSEISTSQILLFVYIFSRFNLVMNIRQKIIERAKKNFCRFLSTNAWKTDKFAFCRQMKKPDKMLSVRVKNTHRLKYKSKSFRLSNWFYSRASLILIYSRLRTHTKSVAIDWPACNVQTRYRACLLSSLSEAASARVKVNGFTLLSGTVATK